MYYLGTIECEIRDNIYDDTIIDTYDNTKPALTIDLCSNWIANNLRVNRTTCFAANSDTLYNILRSMTTKSKRFHQFDTNDVVMPPKVKD